MSPLPSVSAGLKLHRLVRLLTLMAALSALGCALLSPPPKILKHTGTKALRTPESLPVDVIEYTWSFFNSGRHIRLEGRVLNNSSESYQAVSLSMTLRDESGFAVAQSSTHVYPAYLPPGGEGSFETVAMAPSPGRNLTAGLLETTAQVGR